MVRLNVWAQPKIHAIGRGPGARLDVDDLANHVGEVQRNSHLSRPLCSVGFLRTPPAALGHAGKPQSDHFLPRVTG